MRIIYLIIPYKQEEDWVFDDATLGIQKEPFIHGADVMLNRMVQGIPGAEKGFRLLFSSTSFESYQFQLNWLRSENGGDWYHSPEFNQEAWVSPVLYRYFPVAPATIYLKLD